jgi:YidC/Oxa1 family membrane protein insertase
MTSLIRKLFLITIFNVILAIAAFGDQTRETTRLITTPLMNIVFTADGNVSSISSTYSIKNNKKNTVFSALDKKQLVNISSKSGFFDSCFSAAPVQYSRVETDSTLNISFVSTNINKHVSLHKCYTIYKKSYITDYSLIINTDSAKEFSTKDKIDLTLHADNEQNDRFHFFSIGNHSRNEKLLRTEGSTSYKVCGLRNRFWTILVHPIDTTVPVLYDSVLTFRPDFSLKNQYSFRIYSGPIVYKELHKIGTNATKLLYPLWFWMRWLSFGLMLIFDFLLHSSDSVVISIVLLSVCVKVLIAPLYKIANDWQRKVNEQKSIVQPRLDEINRKYRGEEKTKLTLALYKELGISPLYTLKSLLSAAIQIPIFFAAYHMLSEHIALNHVSFLWIDDLSLPDHLTKLPFTIPFVGAYLNILPFIMTSITFAASWLHSDSSLSPVLQKKQQTNLYVMAGLFFVLLYTSPAGMVIYWTMNNALAFFSTLWESKFKKIKIRNSTV